MEKVDILAFAQCPRVMFGEEAGVSATLNSFSSSLTYEEYNEWDLDRRILEVLF